MPFATSGFSLLVARMLLVVMPFVPSSDALVPSSVLAPSSMQLPCILFGKNQSKPPWASLGRCRFSTRPFSSPVPGVDPWLVGLLQMTLGMCLRWKRRRERRVAGGGEWGWVMGVMAPTYLG